MSAYKDAKKTFEKILILVPFDGSDVNMQSESKKYLEDLQELSKEEIGIE